MKVTTNLKSGALLQDAANTAVQAAGEVGDFFTKAGSQAQSLTTSVTTKAANLWNCLTH
jgi:hypothetical protein